MLVKIVRRLHADGMPKQVIDRISTVFITPEVSPAGESNAGGSFHRRSADWGCGLLNACLTIREDMLASPHSRYMILAHELGHCWEYVAGGGGMFLSTYFLKNRYTPARGNSWPYSPAGGDLLVECISAWGLQCRVKAFETLNYPLAMPEFTVEQMQQELWAQTVALFFSHRDAVREHMPKAFAIIEEASRERSTTFGRGLRAALRKEPVAGKHDDGSDGKAVPSTAGSARQRKTGSDPARPRQRRASGVVAALEAS